MIRQISIRPPRLQCTWCYRLSVRGLHLQCILHRLFHFPLTTCSTAPMLWGPVSDHLGRRPASAACLLILSLSCIGLALVPTSDFWLLMLLRCGRAAGSASTIAIGNLCRASVLYMGSTHIWIFSQARVSLVIYPHVQKEAASLNYLSLVPWCVHNTIMSLSLLNTS